MNTGVTTRSLSVLLATIMATVLMAPAAAGAKPAAPAGLDAYAAVNFEEKVDPEDMSSDVFLEWGLVGGATAYEISSPDEGWSFRCRSIFETVTPDDPRAPVVRGIGLDLAFVPGGFATWRLPLGAVSATGGASATIFPEGESTTVVVRALPTISSSAGEASEAATITLSWHDQPTRSSIAGIPTPWGVRIVRSSTATGPGGARVLDGRLEAALDGVTYGAVEQYSKGPGGEQWTPLNFPPPGLTQLVLGADPTVWPRYGYVLENGFTYGRVRTGTTAFDPRARSVRYRQVHRPEIQELPFESNDFYRFAASSATWSYTPALAPLLRQAGIGAVQARGTKSWSSTIGTSAAAKARVRWTLYRRSAATVGSVTPATAWTKAGSGLATYGRRTGSTTPYRLTVPLARTGMYRLDVTYEGSSVARPDGYSRIFSVK